MKKFISKRSLTASLLGLTAFGAVFGSAASLGGINANNLGADARVVASCDTDGVGVTYTRTYQAGGYRVTGVTVTGVNAGCNGQRLSVTLTNTADAKLSDGEVVVPATGTDHAVSLASAVSAAEVANVHVVIAP